MKKIIRTATVPLSLRTFCLDLFDELRGRYQLLAVSSPGADLDIVEQRGTPVRAVKMERRISVVSDLRSLVALVRLFRKERPDMVHSITPKAGLLSMVAAWIARVPVRLHSFTGLVSPTATGLQRLVLTATDRLTCACATHIHAEGEGVRADLIKCGITGKELTVLHHGNIRGVDLDCYRTSEEVSRKALAIREELGIPDGAFTFIYVGRVVRDKGICELIQAYSSLRREGRDIHLLLVGVEEPDDPLSPDTRRMIFDDPAIHFTEKWVNDLRPYYCAAQALVFPSYREGFPNVVLEAGAMCLPSVVTDINGSREIVSDGVNGLVVPPRDPGALCDAMKELIDNPDILPRMGASARKVVEEKFDARDVRAALIEYYADILGPDAYADGRES